MARQYYVDDTSDPVFPEIKVWRDGYQYPWIKPLTLAQAKEALISSARHHRDHWQDQINRARALRASDIPEV